MPKFEAGMESMLDMFVFETGDLLEKLDDILMRTEQEDTIGTEDIEKALVDRRGIEQEAAHRIARFAQGSWMAALDTLDAQSENREFLEDFINLTRKSFMRDVAGMRNWSMDVAKYGREKQRRMLTYFQRMVRESFISNFHNPELTYMTLEEENFVKRFAPFVNENNVMELSELMEKASFDIGRNVNAKMVFFDITLQVTVLLRK